MQKNSKEVNLNQKGEEGMNTDQEQTVVLKDETLKKLKGFVQIPRFILLTPKLSFGAKIIYSVLLSYAWQDNFCFPAQKALAVDMGIKERQTRNLLAELKRAGLIDWKQRGLNRPNIYYILPINNQKSNKNKERQYFAAPVRQNMSGQERQNIAYKEEPLEEDSFKTLNVNVIKKSSLNGNLPKGDKEDFLLMDIQEICHDKKSEGFYRRVIRLCPETMLRRVIHEVKGLKLEHQLKSTPGAAFNFLIQRECTEQGIDLGLKKT